MARYFKYKSLDDLRADVERLGLHLPITTDLSSLFEEARVGSTRVASRFCIQPMEGCDANPDGTPGELTLRRYRRFGSGGAKLIWGEAAAVVPEGRANPRQLLALPSHRESLARLVDACRSAHRGAFVTDDVLLGLQLTHSGRYSHQRPLIACYDPLLDRRTIVDRSTQQPLDAAYPLISDDDLFRLQDAYIAAAKTVWLAGFQFVDVKQCHRYLLNELLTAHTRPGRFGGSYENRTRFAREVIERIRQEVPDLMVGTRLNVYDGVPFATGPGPVGTPESCPSPTQVWGAHSDYPEQPDLSEPVRWVADLHALGVVMVNVTLGNPYASPHLLRPFETPPPDGYETPEHPLVGVDRHLRLAGDVQTSQPGLPCVGSGYSWLQEFLFHVGAAQVQQGRITFVGVGRGALAQPDFVKQLMDHGRLDRKRVCRTFSYCTALMRSKHHPLGQFATGCPPFDKEVYMPIWKEAQREASVPD
jgi:NADPH2 dehydrogenase